MALDCWYYLIYQLQSLCPFKSIKHRYLLLGVIVELICQVCNAGLMKLLL